MEPKPSADFLAFWRAALRSELSRREVLQRGTALGISGGVLATLLAACGGSNSDAPASGSASTSASSSSSSSPTPFPTTAPPPASSGSGSPAASPAAAGTAASTTAATSTSAGQAGGTLKLGLGKDFTILDTHVTSAVSDGIFMMAVYDRLIERQPNGKLYPGLATSWTVSDDGLTWTFKLRQGVKFHDGTPFNADAVVFNFNRMVDPATKSEYAIFELGPYDSSSAVDDYTVELKMKRKYSALIAGLTTYGMGMVSPTAAKNLGEDFAQKPVGTGPFMFKEWVQKDHLTIVQNPDYNWASGRENHQGTSYLDSVTFQFIPETSTRAASLQQGQIDAAGRMAASDWVKVKGDSNFTTSNIFLEGYPPAGLFMNVTKAPTDDVNVRQAIMHAINRDEIIQVVFEGTTIPANGIISPFSWAYDPDSASMYPFDVDKANSMLDAAGWVKNGDYRSKGGQELSLIYLTFTTLTNLAQVVQAQLKKIGVKTDIVAEDNPAQQQDAEEGKHNLVWTQWEGVDPADLHKIFGSENIGNGWNFSHYSNKDVDQWLNDGEAETDADKRKEIYNKVQMQVMGDAAYIPLYNVSSLWAFKKDYQNVDVVDELGASPLLYDISLKKS